MKIEVTCKAYIDIDISKPDFWNSDTINEYKEDLLAEIGNITCDQIWKNPVGQIAEELEIVNVTPYDEGCEEFENILKDWQKHYDERPDDLKIDVNYEPQVTYHSIQKHDDETNSDYTICATPCTKVVSPCYRDELDNLKREIDLMLLEFIEEPLNKITLSLIKFRVRNIIDKYIEDKKIPDFITENDFTINLNGFNI
jgi:hypothetical protein